MGWNLKTKFCCIAPGKRNVSRDSLQGFCNSYVMFWIIEVIRMTVAKWLAHPTSLRAVRDRFPEGEFANLLFNYFNGSNKVIIGGEAEMRGAMVKCGERPLEEGAMGNSRDAPDEHGGRYLVYAGLNYRIILRDYRNAFPWHELLN